MTARDVPGYPSHGRTGPVVRRPAHWPTTGRKIDRLLAHVDVVTVCRIVDALGAAEKEGVAVDFDDGPVLYEVRVPFLAVPGSLGALCAETNEAIRRHFDEWGAEYPSGLSTIVTSGAMLSGNFDQALAYLLGWVAVDTGEED